jgi:hypothetical protein
VHIRLCEEGAVAASEEISGDSLTGELKYVYERGGETGRHLMLEKTGHRQNDKKNENESIKSDRVRKKGQG